VSSRLSIWDEVIVNQTRGQTAWMLRGLCRLPTDPKRTPRWHDLVLNEFCVFTYAVYQNPRAEERVLTAESGENVVETDAVTFAGLDDDVGYGFGGSSEGDPDRSLLLLIASSLAFSTRPAASLSKSAHPDLRAQSSCQAAPHQTPDARPLPALRQTFSPQS
jgi:hypothetical protein